MWWTIGCGSLFLGDALVFLKYAFQKSYSLIKFLPGNFCSLNVCHSMPGRNMVRMLAEAQMGCEPILNQTQDSRTTQPYSKRVRSKSPRERKIFLALLSFSFFFCLVCFLCIDVSVFSFIIDQPIHWIGSRGSIFLLSKIWSIFDWQWKRKKEVNPELMQMTRQML